MLRVLSCLTEWQGQAVSGRQNEKRERAVSGSYNLREGITASREYI